MNDQDIESAIRKIETAQRGTRHNTAYNEAKRLFRDMTEDEIAAVAPRLVRAATKTGINLHQATKEIAAAYIRRHSDNERPIAR